MATKKLSFNPELQAKAGFLKIADDLEDPPLQDAERRTLLHLLFWFTYDRRGRMFLKANLPSAGIPVDQARTNLTNEFRDKFGITDERLLGALIDAHIAGDQFASIARQSQTRVRMPQEQISMDDAERTYELNLQIIMDALHDDAMGHEFSMNW